MKFIQVIMEVTGNLNHAFRKASASLIKGLHAHSSTLESDYYSFVQKSDKEKIADDFRKVGDDLYHSLGKYGADHGY